MSPIFTNKCPNSARPCPKNALPQMWNGPQCMPARNRRDRLCILEDMSTVGGALMRTH